MLLRGARPEIAAAARQPPLCWQARHLPRLSPRQPACASDAALTRSLRAKWRADSGYTLPGERSGRQTAAEWLACRLPRLGLLSNWRDTTRASVLVPDETPCTPQSRGRAGPGHSGWRRAGGQPALKFSSWSPRRVAWEPSASTAKGSGRRGGDRGGGEEVVRYRQERLNTATFGSLVRTAPPRSPTGRRGPIRRRRACRASSRRFSMRGSTRRCGRSSSARLMKG